MFSSSEKMSWDTYYKMLLKFIEVVGHPDVPDKRHLTRKLSHKELSSLCFLGINDSLLTRLAYWTKQQKVRYAQVQNLKKMKCYPENDKRFMSQSQIDKLNDIDFKWSISNDDRWKENYELLFNHYSVHKNLKIKKKNEPKLYKWCWTQRRAFQNEVMIKSNLKPHSGERISDDQIEELKEIGFIF